MDFFVWVLFTVLGGAVGAGITSMLIKERLAKEEEQKELDRQSERLGFSDQLEDMRNKMSDVREEGKHYWEELQQKNKECRELKEQVESISGLEENIASLRTKSETLEQEKNDYFFKVQELEEDLALEKETIKDCLFFVQGSHYLPGSVVQNLMKQAKKIPIKKKDNFLGHNEKSHFPQISSSHLEVRENPWKKTLMKPRLPSPLNQAKLPLA